MINPLKKIRQFISKRTHRSQKQILLPPKHTFSLQYVDTLLGVKLFPTTNLALLTVINQKQFEKKNSNCF